MKFPKNSWETRLNVDVDMSY